MGRAGWVSSTRIRRTRRPRAARIARARWPCATRRMGGAGWVSSARIRRPRGPRAARIDRASWVCATRRMGGAGWVSSTRICRPRGPRAATRMGIAPRPSPACIRRSRGPRAARIGIAAWPISARIRWAGSPCATPARPATAHIRRPICSCAAARVRGRPRSRPGRPVRRTCVRRPRGRCTRSRSRARS